MAPDADRSRRLAAQAAAWERPLLLTHGRPDGDAVGCVVSMHHLLRRPGSAPQALWLDPPPKRYAFLCAETGIDCPSSPAEHATALNPDGVLILDTCAYSQLSPLADWLRTGPGAALPKIVVDHHRTRDPITDDALIDESASAAALLVLEWAECAGWTISAAVADALFVGLATDTGWFRYSNTDARTLAAAARLADGGANASALFEAVYACEPAARLQLEADAVQSMERIADGRIAIMTLRPHDRRSAGPEVDTSDIVNLPLRIGEVWLAALIITDPNGQVRVSLRSKPPRQGVPDINVADIAASLGGGGHARAAGARISGTLEEARAKLLSALPRLPEAKRE